MSTNNKTHFSAHNSAQLQTKNKKYSTLTAYSFFFLPAPTQHNRWTKHCVQALYDFNHLRRVKTAIIHSS